MLASTNEELKKSQYAMKEKDFIISEQKKSGIFFDITLIKCLKSFLTCCILPENVLVQQACILQSNLEKATKDNSSLHQKIGICIYYFLAVFYIRNFIRIVKCDLDLLLCRKRGQA